MISALMPEKIHQLDVLLSLLSHRTYGLDHFGVGFAAVATDC